MINIPKAKITYSLLSEDQLFLENIKDFNGDRISAVIRQMTPDDLDTFELLQKDLTAGKITSREMDDRSFAKLIVKWGDRSTTPTSLELSKLPLETRGVLQQVFQQFCMPAYEVVAADDERPKTENNFYLER